MGLLKRVPRWARAALLIAALLVVAAAGWRMLPRAPLGEIVTSSCAVYDAEGRLLRLSVSADDKYRLWVPLGQVSPALVQAVLLHEDRWFHYHPGFNPVALLRGALNTYSGRQRQGGSTLTMQLARIRSGMRTRTPWGKLRQVVHAVGLELSYSKREILEAYLNLVPYSNNIEGVGAASLIYFGKPPDRLTLAEALSLAVIPQSPARRSPGSQTDSLRDARNRLYARWVDAHGGSGADKDLIGLPLRLRSPAVLPFQAPHLVDSILAHDESAAQIQATIDARLQKTLERQIAQHILRERRLGVHNAAAMLVDFRTMEVKALVGSADFFDDTISGQVNGARARRSPGSTLKPFLYALAIDQGLLHPMTVLKDAPAAFGPYSPENFDGGFAGPITAQDALIRSRNVPAVSVAARLSGPSLHGFLRDAGVGGLHGEDHYGLGIALGGAELTMEELAMLYAALGNRGVLRPLRFRGADPLVEGARVLSEEASFITLDMLRHNPRPDQASAATPSALPVYWKTGTSWGFRDAWTAGLFGPYVLVVWVGNFDGSANPAFIGVQMAAPLFFRIVDAVRIQQRGLHEPAARIPPNLARIEVCAASGELPNAHCPKRTTTWFVPGKSPIRMSDVHRAVAIDRRTGLQACPPHDSKWTRTEVYEFWPSDVLRLFEQAGMPRRVPPPVDPKCRTAIGEQGVPPRILSPLRGTSYRLRLARLGSESVPLQASTDADAAQVFWFVDERFVGTAQPGATLQWMPRGPGRFVVRAVDDQGRANARELEVTVVQ